MARCYALAPCYTLDNLNGAAADDIARRIETAVNNEVQFVDTDTTFSKPLTDTGKAEAGFLLFVKYTSRLAAGARFYAIKVIATAALEGTGIMIQFADLMKQQVAESSNDVESLRIRVAGPSEVAQNANCVAQAALARAEQPRMERMTQGLVMTTTTCAPLGCDLWRKNGLGLTAAELGKRLCDVAGSLTVVAPAIVRVVHSEDPDGSLYKVKLFVNTTRVPTRETWDMVASAVKVVLPQTEYFKSAVHSCDPDANNPWGFEQLYGDGVISKTEGVLIDWPPLDNIKLPKELFQAFVHSADPRMRSDLYGAYLAEHARLMCTDKNEGVMVLYEPTTHHGQLATQYLVKQVQALHRGISTVTERANKEHSVKLGKQSNQQALVPYVAPAPGSEVGPLFTVVQEQEQKLMKARAQLAWACALPYPDHLSLN